MIYTRCQLPAGTQFTLPTPDYGNQAVYGITNGLSIDGEPLETTTNDAPASADCKHQCDNTRCGRFEPVDTSGGTLSPSRLEAD